MQSSFVVTEISTNGYNIEILDILSLIAILCGILVIITKNPIESVLFLIGLFMCIASILTILGLNFIGLSYLLVYVGAVSILFLFILMLINVRVSELLNNTRNSMPLAIIILILFNYPVRQIIPYSITYDYFTGISDTSNSIFFGLLNIPINILFKLKGIVFENREVYYVTSHVWDGNLSETSHITSIGNIMYTSYSIWLIITSIILLLAMVGSIVITIKQKP
jgi:NADH-ubiquinone oxidoreductase chain 6